MVVTPNLKTLHYNLKNGIKYFELVAEPVQREILPGIYLNGWGFNGSIPGPTIVACPGDTVNIRVQNNLPEEMSLNFHGLGLRNMNDGFTLIEPSPPIQPGEFFDYCFRCRRGGTHTYVSGTNPSKQQARGMCGGFIIQDNKNVQRDYLLILQEFSLSGIRPGQLQEGLFEIDTYMTNGNFFCVNGKCYPAIEPCRVSKGEYCRLRFCNISNFSQPMHLNGHQFNIVASDGNSLSTRECKNTINVGAGETYDCVFCACNPGTWPVCCQRPCAMSNNFTRPLGGMCSEIEYI